ncbi:thioredoxin family protein [Pontibacter sp. G13]|uniref:thioredoxin family protein n=1 Tax=Pontibacter sp. G13 TaxID=3074898 RepID=UPI0028896DC7|nr:thioredoxin family protein [Pontibacter sp. G13]WNJ17600.1 thioredoxin family protein [Pontibacter sp. G13]
MKKLLSTLVICLTMTAAWAQGYSVGDAAADFSLKNIDGKMVSMADFDEAKGFVVVFTCNHCPYAKMYEERLVDLDKAYAQKGYPIIAINPNDANAYPEDDFASMKVRAEERGFTFPYLVDGNSEIARTFGATRTPHVYLLNKEGGELKVRYIGAIDDNARDASSVEDTYLANAIDALLAGDEIAEAETRAVGCSIKFVGQ